MNCLLIDDERPALELLEDNIKQIPFLNIVASCRKPMEALEVFKTQRVDLIFWDIHMPGLNGLDLLRSLSNPPVVILVTAYGEHALDGFNLDVVDYLLKSVPFSRLPKAARKAHALFQLIKPVDRHSIPKSDHVFVNANYSLVKVVISDITYIEGMKDYVRINTIDGKPLITRMGLKSIEERLVADNFMRIHKSYIVALDKIESIQKHQFDYQ